MLCEVCTSMLAQQSGTATHKAKFVSTEALKLIHHRNVGSLTSSALSACAICQPLWDHLSQSEQEILEQADNQASETSPIGDYYLTYGVVKPFLEHGVHYTVTIKLVEQLQPYLDSWTLRWGWISRVCGLRRCSGQPLQLCSSMHGH
jgi:hypothetical protein